MRFISRIRLCQNSWQDTGAVWLWKNVPELFFIQFRPLGAAMYLAGDPALRDGDWVRKHVSQGHGPLGAGYPPANATGKRELRVKEGDSPTFLYLLSTLGLSSPEHPEWGSWGGRFRLIDGGGRRHYAPAEDDLPGTVDSRKRLQWTLARWQRAFASDFAARMDWCVKPREEANHAPRAVVDGDGSAGIIQIVVRAGERLAFDAGGSGDPDGDRLRFRWWQYREAGTFPGVVALEGANSEKVQLAAPEAEAGQTVHLILEVTDEGEPSLTSYRRIVLTLSSSLAVD
ncbi:MAG: DUF1593 domain-containing protein [Opitutaceae bacterium]|nr:DUF1593 domain-containing protein [Opitutaceae bacterium]